MCYSIQKNTTRKHGKIIEHNRLKLQEITFISIVCFFKLMNSDPQVAGVFEISFPQNILKCRMFHLKSSAWRHNRGTYDVIAKIYNVSRSTTKNRPGWKFFPNVYLVWNNDIEHFSKESFVEKCMKLKYNVKNPDMKLIV